ncbi:unnamed protein product [Symbiodinium sp. KB8]|nr:unnamed protein product [Symbiodinium sp. KB8]
MWVRKLRKRLGRILELITKHNINMTVNHGAPGCNLCPAGLADKRHQRVKDMDILWKKLRPSERPSYDEATIQALKDEAKMLHSTIKEYENNQFATRIKTWKHDMRSSVSHRATWIAKITQPEVEVMGPHSPESTPHCKKYALDNIVDYWRHLWTRIRWTSQERDAVVDKVVATLRKHAKKLDPGDPPSLEDFIKVARRCKKTHGVDGWTKVEIKCLPKAMLGEVWYNLGEAMNAGFDETIAAIAESQLNEGAFLATLDLSHAFDTVSVAVYEKVMARLLPGSMLGWNRLMCAHWGDQKRWLQYQGRTSFQPITTVLGIPQGDPASPLAVAILLAAAALSVRDKCLKEGFSTKQLIYMDDRTMFTSSAHQLTTMVQHWEAETAVMKFIEHPGKSQFAHKSDPNFAHGIEILGAYLGDVVPEKQLRAQNRLQEAVHNLDRIGHLPRGIWGRLEEVMQYDKKLWQMAGKLNYAVAHLRSLIGGASTQWSAAYVWRAVNLLRRTTKWAGLLDFNLDFLTLRSLVRDALSEFGWTVEGNGWRHVDCGFFNLSTEAHRVGHMLRESWRRLHYGKLAGSNRHELHGEVIPAYDEQRCTNVRKKARLHRNVGFCLVTGAVQSAKVRAVGRGGKEIRCGDPRTEVQAKDLEVGKIKAEIQVVKSRKTGKNGKGKMRVEALIRAERVALASVLNRLGDAKKIRGVVRLYTSAALCISCLAAFCHCKRLLTSLFFEISCDSADESQRWSDTAAGGEESLDKFRTSGFASAFVSKMHVISHIALAGRNPGRQVDRGRFGVCLWWRVHWRCPRFRLASLEDPAEQRDGRSLAAALGLACHEVYDISHPACPSRVAAELQPDEQGVSRSPWLSLSLPTVDASLTTTEADLSKLPKIGQGMDKSEFLDLLKKLIGESKHLQNNPRLGIHPEEKRAAAVVIKELEAVSTRAGGPLILEELEYVPGRSNLKVTYPGSGKETTAFVGSHFDVVPADPEAWSKDPFQLTVEGDLLYGRGTTDCLGHVALLTLFLRELGRTKPALKRSIVVVFIAAEEGGEKNIGVDAVLKNGKLEEARNGPVYWVDSADSNPCCGTAGALSWSLKCRGRLFHSGFPNKAINSIELANEAIAFIQERFYNDFKPLPEEELYSFVTGSHMKPTQIECSKGSFNQIPAETTVHGDIRLSPFYEVEDVVEHIERYVQELNDDMECLMSSARGPWSKFVLPSGVQVQDGEVNRAKVELKWMGDMDTFRLYAGLAVKLESDGHKALVQAFRESNKGVQPFSINGSLPLVKMMQKAGFDIQMCGFGKMSVYHGVNEYCTFSEMTKAHEVIVRLICLLEMAAK